MTRSLLVLAALMLVAAALAWLEGRGSSGPEPAAAAAVVEAPVICAVDGGDGEGACEEVSVAPAIPPR